MLQTTNQPKKWLHPLPNSPAALNSDASMDSSNSSAAAFSASGPKQPRAMAASAPHLRKGGASPTFSMVVGENVDLKNGVSLEDMEV